VIFRELDGLCFRIENHTAIISRERSRGITASAAMD